MQKKKMSQKQEKCVAKELGGKTVIASGAFAGSKGDVKTDFLLIECKTTTKDFYALSSKTWNKIYNEALSEGGRYPVMCIDLPHERVAVFHKTDFPFIHSAGCFARTETSKSVRITTSESVDFFLFKEGNMPVNTFLMQKCSWNTFLEMLEEHKEKYRC